MIQRVEVIPGRPALRRFDASRVRIQVSTLQPRTLPACAAERESTTGRQAPAVPQQDRPTGQTILAVAGPSSPDRCLGSEPPLTSK